MPSDSYKAFLELEARVSGLADIKAAVASINPQIALQMDTRGFKELASRTHDIQKLFKGISDDARSVGLELGGSFEKMQSQMETKLSQQYGEMFNLQERLVAAQGAGDQLQIDHMKNLIGLQRAQIQAAIQGSQEQVKDYQEFVDEKKKEHEAETKRVRELEDARRGVKEREHEAETKRVRELEDARRGVKEREQQGFAGNIDEATQDFSSMWGRLSSNDLPGVFENFGKMFAKGAERGQQRAAVAGEDGIDPGMLGKLSGTLGTLATSVAAFAAVAGVIAAVVGVLNQLDKGIKETNQSILEGSGLADLYWSGQYKGAADLAEGLGSVRGALHSFSDNAAWRTTAEEQAAIIQAFNEGGLAIKEMTSNLKDQAQVTRDLRGATEQAMTYAKLLGESETAVASTMAEYMEELGLGLSTVGEGFSTTTKAAMMSGFGVKRFYSMVQQATSGMSLYNVRMEDAANLLMTLGKVMSPRAAGEFLQMMTKGFSEKSIQDRIKTMMVSGYTSSMQVLEMDAAKFGDRFLDEFSGSLQAAGLDVSGGTKGVLSQLENMDATQRSILTANLAAMEGNGQRAAQQLQDLINMSERGDGMISAAIAAGSMSAAGQMVSQLQMFGKPLFQIAKDSPEQLMAYQEQAGITGEQLTQMVSLSNLLYGQFETLQSGQEGVATTNKEMIAQIQKFGGYLGPNGVMVGTIKDKQVINRRAVDSWQEFALGQDALIAASEDAMTEDQAQAEALVQNTRQIADLIGMGTNSILNWIGGMVDGIWGKLLGSEERRVDVENAEDRVRALDAERENQQNKIRDLENKLRTTSGPSERVGISQDLEAAKGEAEMLQAQQEYATLYARKLRGVTGFAVGADVARRKATEGMEGGAQQILVDHLGEDRATELMAEARQMETASKEAMEIYRARALMTEGMTTATAPQQVTAAEAAMDLLQRELTQGGKDQVTATEFTTTAIDQLNADMVGNLVKANKITSAHELLQMADYQGRDFNSLAEGIATGNPESLRKALEVVRGQTLQGAMTPELGSMARKLGITSPVDDFIYRKGGNITPINTQDDLVGFKPGGPIAGMGGGMVNITINGGDQAAVYNTVKRALRSSGLRT